MAFAIAEANSAPSAELAVGGHLADRYVVLELLGTGGSGAVYRVKDESSGKVLAFKQLSSVRAGKRAKMLEALFEREYHTLVRLRHPRIIEVYDYGLTAAGPYYTMELLDGGDLARAGRLHYLDLCRHLRDIASSLALLHSHGLVHRDVTPRNIRLTENGTAKLIDFGALAPFGVAGDVVGTPPFMAPETLLSLAIDHRTDLFSLGGVAYFSLTGRHAYGARLLSELPEVWERPVPPPSVFSPGIPEELDKLVLSLLSRDALMRPQSAAAVIDQLTAIGELPPEPHERAEDSYILSSQMVGRAAEMGVLSNAMARAAEGQGVEILVEGAPGIGKTRLLTELSLAASLRGAVVAKADGESTENAFGVAAALALRLLTVAPALARRTAEPHASALRSLSPEVSDQLGGVDSGQRVHPSEQRIRLQAAIHDWILEIAKTELLVLAVDNLHAVDLESAAFFAALGREAGTRKLLLVTTQRTGSAVTAEEPVRLMSERTQRLKLTALDATACELLTSALFGNAANSARVANLLYERGGGVPQQLLDLAQLMVRRKIARHTAGSWVLPLEVGEAELPARADEVVSAKFAQLSRGAVDLAELLSIHTRPVAIRLALAVAGKDHEAEVHGALAELVSEQIVVNEGARYRFLQETVRQAVLSRMNPERRSAIHRSAAEGLLVAEDGDSQQVALHLIDAGDEERGARLLADAARQCLARLETMQFSNQGLRTLHHIVREYDARGRSDFDLAQFLFPLIPLAYHSANWQMVLEYGPRALEVGMRITGLSRAAELASELGPAAALSAGLAAGGKSFATQVGNFPYDLKSAIAAVCGLVPAIVGVSTTCLDTESVERVGRYVAPLKLFGEQHVAHVMHLFAIADTLVVQGSESEGRVWMQRTFERLAEPAVVQVIGEGHAKAIQGGCLFTIGIVDSYLFGDKALRTADAMDALGVHTWTMGADQVRLLYYAYRGETEKVNVYRERVELAAVQGNATWQAEMFWPMLLLTADVLTSDAMGARRIWAQLERRSKDVPSLERNARAAYAAYLLLRGDVDKAVSQYEELLPSFGIRRCVGWGTTRTYFARALNEAGQHERAKVLLLEVLANFNPFDADCAVHVVEVERQLAIAEAALGDTTGAAARLDALLSAHGHKDNDLLIGLLHQARAEVAQVMTGTGPYETHRSEMEKRFRRTKNPALVAQCERNLRAREREPGDAHPHTVASTAHTVNESLARLMAEIDAAPEPLAAALDLAIRRAAATNGYLFVVADGEHQLVSSTTSRPPPPALFQNTDATLACDVEENGLPVLPFVSGLDDASRYRVFPLEGEHSNLPLGALVLEYPEAESSDVSPTLLRCLSMVIGARARDAGVSTPP